MCNISGAQIRSIHSYGETVLGNAALGVIQCRSFYRFIQDSSYFSGNTEDTLAVRSVGGNGNVKDPVIQL